MGSNYNNKKSNAKKDNFNQAMSDMFGIGKSASAATGEPVIEKVEKVDLGAKIEPATASAEDFRPLVRKTTYVAQGTVIEGSLKTENDVEIAGELRGDITAGGAVTIHSNINGNITAAVLSMVSCTLTGDAKVSGSMSVDAQSSVVGNINASELHCAGKIVGDLVVSGNVCLEDSAQINGNITAGTMTMARGAKIRGKIEMKEA